ncbi:MAG: serine acetyltransferase [Lewinellaceae bacterium]|nr:serine acetyltransferase [Lewinellaceae bacterium]
MQPPFIEGLFGAHLNARQIPAPSQVCNWLNGLLGVLFPEYADHRFHNLREFSWHYQQLQIELHNILDTIREDLPRPARELEEAFMDRLPEVHQRLQRDAEAILRGDPAAVTITEVIRTYPGFYAIAVFRLAHEFYQLGVPLIPRILTEHAHGKTGIDIHPGAQVGDNFCIDHGTGVVIGETCIIGNDVKIYQGVTLGALSVAKELAKTKRHPTIEDRVVIYSGATILGGETTIGRDTIIGGNVWITRSVPPQSRVYYAGYERMRHLDGSETTHISEEF